MMKRAGSSLDEGGIVKSDRTTPTIQQMCPDGRWTCFQLRILSGLHETCCKRDLQLKIPKVACMNKLYKDGPAKDKAFPAVAFERWGGIVEV
jgi:hypothetical protein